MLVNIKQIIAVFSRCKQNAKLRMNALCILFVTFAGKNGEHLYLEGDDPRPLTVADDSTLVIQHSGVLYTWRLSNDIATEWGTDIREIMAADLARRDDERERQSYVLSPKERRQANVIHGFIFSTIVIVVLLLKKT